MPNDHPQGRGASPRPPGGPCSRSYFPKLSTIVLNGNSNCSIVSGLVAYGLFVANNSAAICCASGRIFATNKASLLADAFSAASLATRRLDNAKSKARMPITNADIDVILINLLSNR